MINLNSFTSDKAKEATHTPQVKVFYFSSNANENKMFRTLTIGELLLYIDSSEYLQTCLILDIPRKYNLQLDRGSRVM